MGGRSRRPNAFLSRAERERVEEAIAAAEGRTSAEIRVLISRRVRGDPLAAARDAFRRLGMDRTRERNGVLVLLAVADRRFAILGDEGVDRHLGAEGWGRVRDRMEERFRADDFAGGLVAAVQEVGRVLQAPFPRRADDRNELPDQLLEE